MIPLEFQGKNEFLDCVGAKDCIKEEVRWKQGLQLAQTVQEQNDNPKKKKKRKPKSEADTVLNSSLSSPY